MSAGYYRFPTIHHDTIVFVSEDDLWSVSATGGAAHRLTSNLGEVTYPMLSPDGQGLAFVGREEGAPELYVMSAEGGSARRLTYQSSDCRIVGWTPDGSHILYTSPYGQPHTSAYALFQIPADSLIGESTQLPYGLARTVSFGPGNGVILGRNTGDPARWKRYQGGIAGNFWIDLNGDGEFSPFLPGLAGNLASPMWLTTSKADQTGRIYFVSDHEGIGNLYSATPTGEELRRHTDHAEYYVRNPSPGPTATGGHQIVYHAGADLFVYDIQGQTDRRVDVLYRSPRVQRNRKFVYAGSYMDGIALHPSGKAISLTSRGKSFSFFNHEGPVLQNGKRDGVRYRQPRWLNDAQRLLLVSDEAGEETLEIYDLDAEHPRQLTNLDLGRVVAMKISPTSDKVALTNHRQELMLVDLEQASAVVVDSSLFKPIQGFSWSPDGRWLAYSHASTLQTAAIRLYRLPDPEAEEEAMRQGEIFTITQPVLEDIEPAFDPDGKYLYFLSFRVFNPVYDGLHLDLGFPMGMRPYLITLQADLPNPFTPRPDGDEEEEEGYGPESEEEAGEEEEGVEDLPEGEEDDPELMAAEDDLSDGYDLSQVQLDGGQTVHPHHRTDKAETSTKSSRETNRAESKETAEGKDGSKENPTPPPVLQVDLTGIERRVLAFPVPEGRYGQIEGIPGKALFTWYSVQSTLGEEFDQDEPDPGGELECYSFKEYKTETLATQVDWFELSLNQKKVLYVSDHRLRVINAGEKAPSGSGNPRKTGWIDLTRVKISVDPQSEWEQMFREAWRLQRDQFWTEDMSQVDWQRVYERYFPLIDRVSSRSEFSDLMWEMQGELGTSHAYEFGGDYRPQPIYGQGFLAADLRWDVQAGGYRIGEPVQGDPWDPSANSPLADPGIDIQPGDVIVAVNGQSVGSTISPAHLLVNQAGQEVLLSLHPRPKPPANQTETEQTETEQVGTEQDAEPNETEPIGPATKAESAFPSPPFAPADLRPVVVRTLYSERQAHYRAWVEGNRRTVHQATEGRVGYVHIPDMGPGGYGEFHRGYLAEVDRDALIVDVRFNSGGHVSQLLLEKLARRRLGYDLNRWGGIAPYPADSVAGPLVALTNEYAGSDGDIFSHCFKMMGLGPLIGKRTWGGVIGVWPRHSLVDGTVTTQPEFSFWAADVGWSLENYGTDPDIEVDNTPQDYAAGQDAQLQRGIAEILQLLESNPPLKPDLSRRPSRALPKLPPRK